MVGETMRPQSGDLVVDTHGEPYATVFDIQTLLDGSKSVILVRGDEYIPVHPSLLTTFGTYTVDDIYREWRFDASS